MFPRVQSAVKERRMMDGGRWVAEVVGGGGGKGNGSFLPPL